MECGSRSGCTSPAARARHRARRRVRCGGARADIRVSFDDDHVLSDLRNRFDDVLEHLERQDGWVTARLNRPVLILGSLDGIETGIRQLIRTRPLEVEDVEGPGGPVTGADARGDAADQGVARPAAKRDPRLP